MNKHFKSEKPLVSCVTCTYGRFTCIERSISMFLDQDYQNKELIIFNTADVPLVLDESLRNSNIKIINNSLSYDNNLPYTNIGDIRKDSITHTSGEVYICWDDDDLYQPFHISRGISKLIECGKRAWKPKTSLFSRNGGQTFEYCENQMEASILVDIEAIKEYGFKKETGSEHLGWIAELHYKQEQFHIEEVTPLESYCFNWGDSFAPHKQSGNIGAPNNFENHKEASKDFGEGNLLKKSDVSEYYFRMWKLSRSQQLKEILFDYVDFGKLDTECIPCKAKNIDPVPIVKNKKILPTEFVEARRKYILFKNDCGLTDAIRRGGQYESYLYDYIKNNNINIEGTDVIDIGANLGCHTLEFAELVGDNGRVFAFEPQRIVFQQLCGNISLNGFDNVFAYNEALGNNSNFIKIEKPNYFSNEIINIGDTHTNKWLQGGSELVAQHPLDIFKNLFKKISIIKIDVQGYEVEVLKGAKDVINEFKPIIFIEIEEPQLANYGESKESVLNILNEYGYDVKKTLEADHLVDYVAIPRI